MLIRTKDAFFADGKIKDIKYEVNQEKNMPTLKFSLAVDKDPNDTKKWIWINCACYWEKAKNWQYLSEKMEVIVCGKYDVKDGKDRDGNPKKYENYYVSSIFLPLQFNVQEEQCTTQPKAGDESEEGLPF